MRECACPFMSRAAQSLHSVVILSVFKDRHLLSFMVYSSHGKLMYQ